MAGISPVDNFASQNRGPSGATSVERFRFSAKIMREYGNAVR
jgi:hypothetical protein